MTKRRKEFIWKKTVNGKFSQVWEKVEKGSKPSPILAKKFIKLNKQSKYIRENFKGSNWEVMANKKINPKTQFGKTKNFKTKTDAMRFIKRYISKN